MAATADRAALQAAIKEQGETVRKLKADKAEKDKVREASVVLVCGFGRGFRRVTGATHTLSRWWGLQCSPDVQCECQPASLGHSRMLKMLELL